MFDTTRFPDNRHMKVKSLLALGTDRLYPQGNTPGTYFCLRLSRPQKIQSIKNTNNTIGNRIRDLPACSTVPPPTEPRHTRNFIGIVETKQDRQCACNVTLRRFLASMVTLEKQCVLHNLYVFL